MENDIVMEGGNSGQRIDWELFSCNFLDLVDIWGRIEMLAKNFGSASLMFKFKYSKQNFAFLKQKFCIFKTVTCIFEAKILHLFNRKFYL